MYLIPTALVLGLPALAAAQVLTYPPTRVEAQTDQLHGVEVADPYRWLESADAAEVRAWSDAQNALTRSELDRFDRPRAALRARLDELFEGTVTLAPRFAARSRFYLKRDGPQAQPRLYVQTGAEDEPKLLLDPAALSEDGSLTLAWWTPSPDGAFLLYGIAPAGAGADERTTLRLREVAKPGDTALEIPGVIYGSVAWAPESAGFYYARRPDAPIEPGSPPAPRFELFYHRFGTPLSDDPRIEIPRPEAAQSVRMRLSADARQVFLTLLDSAADNRIYLRTAPTEFKPLSDAPGARVRADADSDGIFIISDHAAPRFSIFRTAADKLSRDDWQTVVPQQSGVIEEFALVAGHVAINVLEDGYSRVRLIPRSGGEPVDIELPGMGGVTGLTAATGGGSLHFQFETFFIPPIVFAYDVEKRELKEASRSTAGVEPADYVAKQVWFQSTGQARVPMFVLHRTDVERNGENPTVLTGFGALGRTQRPRFDPLILPWLDAGGVFAIAAVRGGGDFGRQWMLDGRLEHKSGTFDDFAAAAEKLIADRYTRAELLGFYGLGHGGVAGGALITRRPELFRAILCESALFDLIRHHRFAPSGMMRTEYGAADDSAQFKALHAWSPLHHVRRGPRYPAALILSGAPLDAAPSVHARKMAAALQAASPGDRPVLLQIAPGVGPGANRPLAMQLDAAVDRWTFFFSQLGMLE
ncbi:MAG: S9 family peptidase [Phycisphaerales bacterium]|nr:S9 family peptidase [Phycisphaerales bacterium]